MRCCGVNYNKEAIINIVQGDFYKFELIISYYRRCIKCLILSSWVNINLYAFVITITCAMESFSRANINYLLARFIKSRDRKKGHEVHQQRIFHLTRISHLCIESLAIQQVHPLNKTRVNSYNISTSIYRNETATILRPAASQFIDFRMRRLYNITSQFQSKYHSIINTVRTEK
jgi:hypothetical protein